MNHPLTTIFSKAKLNIAVLVAILLFAVLGKIIFPEFTNRVFETADQLISELILLFVAITLGAFIPQFKWVVLGVIATYIAAAVAIQIGVFSALRFFTTDYLLAVLIVVLGFAAIANLYRRYRELGL
ncbi:hypothetical protein [Polynucleobacter antarcticus]|uniref:Uncharacterized protein n=1 Tax=Polynucleobacter antarcticus TaxID=1743162 RepID=A0A6M9PTS7_9BURK|nr:hypothetical protein [Polynucleobacter antarcticus]QKM62287.1 hypothetical protein DCO16_03890 [Polynucleobacter antarcticus]